MAARYLLMSNQLSDIKPYPHQRRYLILAILLLLLVVGGAGYYYYVVARPTQTLTMPSGSGLRVPPVAVATSMIADMGIYLDGLGTVTALNIVKVRARIDGQLINVLFQDGQMVKSGDALAALDPQPLEVQLHQVEAQLARDEVMLQNAQLDLARYRNLDKENAVAKQQLDTQAALARQYQATLRVDQAQIASARLQLSYCHITAPISGRVGLRQVDPGNLIHPSDPNGLVIITQLQPIAVIFSLPEDHLPEVMKAMRTGATLPVEAWSRDGSTRLAEGTLLTVDNQIDLTTGTVKLKAQFANQDESLFPNQFVTIRLRLDTLRGVTTIPSVAIQSGITGTFVYLLNQDQTVSVRIVRIGVRDATQVVVVEGISPGERVVVDGVDKLRDGMLVKVPLDPG